MNKLLSLIATAQQDTGSFLAQSAASPTDFTESHTYTSPFFTGLICQLLAPYRGDLTYGRLVTQITDQATTYLLSQASEQWSFNYWDRQSDQATQQPYPDDLDDTFSNLSAIRLVRPDSIDGAALGAITKMLTTLETAPGGPYRTWLVPNTAKKAWLDIDVAVNAQVAYFLQLLDIEMPVLTKFLAQAITHKKLQSPYYPTAFPLYFYLSRVCPSTAAKKLEKRIITDLAILPATSTLERGLAIIALKQLGAPNTLITNEQTLLTAAVNRDMQPIGYCFDPSQDKQTYYAGATALTAAICFTALAPQTTVKHPNGLRSNKELLALQKTVVNLFMQRIKHCEPNFTDRLVQAKDQIIPFDVSHRITSLPTVFIQTLQPELRAKLSDQKTIGLELGLANLYGWIAYTLFDDLLDGERDTNILPIATFTLRALVATITNLDYLQADFLPLFHQLLDDMEAATYWEAEQARVSPESAEDILEAANITYSFDHYVNRSLGHIVTPLAVLSAIGYATDSQPIKQWQLFFRHYLAARQLNDDAHDWLVDLKAGRLNPVNIALITHYVKIHGKNKPPRLPILYRELEKLFWHDQLAKTSALILDHVKQAKQALTNCSFMTDTAPFVTLLEQPEAAAQQALRQQQQASDFLKTYYDTPKSPRR